MNKLELIKKINDLRKSHKNKWVNITLLYNDEPISIKFYNTWMQVLSYDNKKYSSNMDISVKQFNEFLNESL